MLIAVKTNTNNTVISYAVILNRGLDYEGVLIDTDLDLDLIQIVDNYKLENGQLVELTAEEKQIDICPTKTTEEKLEELVEQVSMMDELIANLMMEI